MYFILAPKNKDWHQKSDKTRIKNTFFRFMSPCFAFACFWGRIEKIHPVWLRSYIGWSGVNSILSGFEMLCRFKSTIRRKIIVGLNQEVKNVSNFMTHKLRVIDSLFWRSQYLSPFKKMPWNIKSLKYKEFIKKTAFLIVVP